MNLPKLIKFAFRNLFRNRRRTIITLCIAAAGFASLALVAGFREFVGFGLQELTIRIGATGTGGVGHIQVLDQQLLEKDESYPLEFGIKKYKSLIKEIEKIDEVFFAMPRVEFGGLISNGEKSVPFMGVGMESEKELQLVSDMLINNWIELKIDNIIFDKLKGTKNGVILGRRLAQSLNVKPGGTLMLLSTTVDGAVNAVDVKLVGAVSTGFSTIDSYYLVTNIDIVQRLVQTDKVSRIVVVLNQLKDLPLVSEKISKKIIKNSSDFVVKSWDKLAQYYHSVRDVQAILFTFMGAVVTVIVILSCSNTMLMATMERIKEIGTLRATGISMNWITAIFMIEGLLIGLASIILGVIFQNIAVFIVNNTGIMMPPPPGMNIPYKLQIFIWSPAIPLIAILVMLSTTISSFITMRKVNKISIVEALNHA